MTIYIGLPAYNERDSIAPLFDKIKSLNEISNNPLEIILYDDGSDDDTEMEVSKWKDILNIRYINGGVNRGLGAGMNTLLSTFEEVGKQGDFLVVMDCDDTHDPAQIIDAMKLFDKNAEINVIVVSRYRACSLVSGVPLHRIMLSLLAAFLYKCTHPIRGVRDYTCGYRAYHYDIISKAFSLYGTPLLKERGFACMVELLLKLNKAGAKIGEIPLNLAYENKQSASKMDVTGNSFRLLRKLISWSLKGMS